MRVIIVKNYDTGEEITRFKTARLANLFSDLNRVMSKEKDPLHLGKEYSVDCGIISSTERGLILSNDPRVINGKGDICYTGPNTEVFGSKVNSQDVYKRQ